MRIRRCAILLIEPREELEFSLASLCDGGDGVASRTTVLALAPHLDVDVVIGTAEIAALGAIGATPWRDFDELAIEHAPTLLHSLIAQGLLISEGEAHATMRARDEKVRSANWQVHSAISHYAGRWHDVASGEEADKAGVTTMSELFARLGPPPPHVLERVDAPMRQPLPEPRRTTLDALLARRATCRNFAAHTPVELGVFSDIMHRVFGAQAAYEIHADNVVLKRNSPSGGGLHPTEAYVVARNVEGLKPGLYHYHPIDHALEPLDSPATEAIDHFVDTLVAKQKYFTGAGVFVVIVARFARMFWKYRKHTKAYRAIVLEAGHLSQNFYLSATEFNLGAFITAAINEIEIEQAFGLDALAESPIAVLGLGQRAAECTTFEFDPNSKVWPHGVDQPR